MKPIEVEIIPVSGDRISVSVNYNVPGAIPMIRRWQVERRTLDEISDDLAAMVSASLSGHGPEGSLENAGRTFFEALFRQQCDRLRDAARGTDIYFIFKVDRSLAHLPFEILNDGERFLSLHFAMGRVIYSEADARYAAAGAVTGERVLILGDPSDDPAIRDDVEREVDSLRDMFRKNSRYATTIAMGREVSERLVLSLLPETALLHFTGHGIEGPGGAGLELYGGAVLSAGPFRGLRHIPAVAFFNTCSTASHQAWKSPIGIMEALISRGTRACIAPVWDVASRAATGIALAFYEHLLSGDTFGEALRKARKETARRGPPGDPTWAAYALYGDPMADLGDRAEPPAGRRRASVALRLFFAVIVALLLILAPRTVDRRMPDVVVPVEVGYVILESEPPDARIFLDGEDVGLTPTAIEVSVGEHQVAIMKKGYRRWQASIDVKKGPETVVRATLQEIEE